MFVINSHLSSVSGKEKIKYNSKETASKSAQKMVEKEAKKGNIVKFSPYKCIFCDGYHIGKTRVF